MDQATGLIFSLFDVASSRAFSPTIVRTMDVSWTEGLTATCAVAFGLPNLTGTGVFK